MPPPLCVLSFFFNDTATTEIYTLSLHDALPISGGASLTIAQGNFTGAGLSISGLTFPLTLAAGQSSTLSVQFAPTATGSVSGSLSLVSDTPESPRTKPHTRPQVQPQLSLVPPSVSFG